MNMNKDSLPTFGLWLLLHKLSCSSGQPGTGFQMHISHGLVGSMVKP